ncbi:MAG TPA: hypothetical protein VF304_07795 [Casimicrobiaceae bacterium]
MPAIFAAISPTDGLRCGTPFDDASAGAAASSFAAALSAFGAGAGAGFAALTGSFDFGGVFDFDVVVLLVPRPLGFVAGRLAGERLRAAVAGFLFPALFAAGRLAVGLLLVAGRDLRAGFICFFAMVILVRSRRCGQGALLVRRFRVPDLHAVERQWGRREKPQIIAWEP